MSLIDRLAALEAAVAEAGERRQRAWRRRQNEFEVSVDPTADLTAYRDGVGFRQREADVEAQRQLTRALFERIEADGLVLEAAGGGAGMLIVRDPAVMQELEDAAEAKAEVTQRLRTFEGKHADVLKAEADAAEAQRIRDALASDDPSEISSTVASGSRLHSSRIVCFCSSRVIFAARWRAARIRQARQMPSFQPVRAGANPSMKRTTTPHSRQVAIGGPGAAVAAGMLDPSWAGVSPPSARTDGTETGISIRPLRCPCAWDGDGRRCGGPFGPGLSPARLGRSARRSH